eukprot:1688649-Rhodomonas_salina.2
MNPTQEDIGGHRWRAREEWRKNCAVSGVGQSLGRGIRGRGSQHVNCQCHGQCSTPAGLLKGARGRRGRPATVRGTQLSALNV